MEPCGVERTRIELVLSPCKSDVQPLTLAPREHSVSLVFLPSFVRPSFVYPRFVYSGKTGGCCRKNFFVGNRWCARRKHKTTIRTMISCSTGAPACDTNRNMFFLPFRVLLEVPAHSCAVQDSNLRPSPCKGDTLTS